MLVGGVNVAMLSRRLLERALSGLVRTGALVVKTADGHSLTFGDGNGVPVVVRFTDAGAQWALLLDPDLKTGELFTDGRLIVEQGDVYAFLSLMLRDQDSAPESWLLRLLEAVRSGLRGLSQRNDAGRAQRNVAHHYDLGDALYSLFLDPEWQYSCAYFEHPSQSLAEAQLAKMRHVAAKLAIGPRDRILDIGCGWGGLACYLAHVAGAAAVHGVTLSDQQLAGARIRAASRGLEDRVSFELTDYRAVTDVFDRIVSVGMFEHVGLPNYAAFFDACRERLSEDGVMLLHTIGVADAPSLTNPWVTKYIFPGGHLPSLSQILPAIERAGLIVTDVEILRLHYAETLRAWREAFLARRDEAARMFDERFCRMWEYYLAMAEAAFRFEKVVVFQLQLTRKVEALPITRDYIAAGEARLAVREETGPSRQDGSVLYL